MTTDPYAFPSSVAVPVRARRVRVPYPAPPAWLPFAALGAGTVAALAIPDNPPGLGTILAVGAVGAALLPAVRRSLSRSDLALGGLLVALLAMVVVRDAPWLLALDLLVVAALGTVVLAGARTWLAFVSAGVTVWARLAPALPYVLRPLARQSRALGAPRARPALRGVVLSAVLLLVFGGLFASADAAFASLLGRLVPTFHVDLVLARVVVGVFTVALVGAGLLTRLRPLPAPSLLPAETRPRAEWAVPLVVLDALFAAFVAVQLAVLFGGHDHVLRTSGLTYAQYARQGFFQLLAVVVLTLGVVAFTVSRVSFADARDRLLARVVLGTLCGLSFVVLASAWRRLALYESAYGLTRLRLLVHAVLAGLGLVLLLVVVAGALWRAAWLPRAFVAVMAVTLLGLNAANPDALIAHRAVTTDRVDYDYLAGLSADAAPALAPLGICVHVAPSNGFAWNRARATASGLSCSAATPPPLPQRSTCEAQCGPGGTESLRRSPARLR
jgi:hypothetical protein